VLVTLQSDVCGPIGSSSTLFPWGPHNIEVPGGLREAIWFKNLLYVPFACSPYPSPPLRRILTGE